MIKNRHIQVFAAFIDKKNDILLPFDRANQLIDYYYSQLEKYSKYIFHCNTTEDAKSAVNCGKTASFLSIEGGEALNGRIENLYYFYTFAKYPSLYTASLYDKYHTTML